MKKHAKEPPDKRLRWTKRQLIEEIELWKKHYVELREKIAKLEAAYQVLHHGLR